MSGARIAVVAVATATEEIRGLIAELDAALSAHYPAEQRHGLAVEAIFQPHIRFFVARLEEQAAGCGGVALLDGFAEVKRMFVRQGARGRGVAQALLTTIEREVRRAGIGVLRLETGDRQTDALRLYEKAGFRPCPAFGAYATMTPHAIATSVFLEKHLA